MTRLRNPTKADKSLVAGVPFTEDQPTAEREAANNEAIRQACEQFREQRPREPVTAPWQPRVYGIENWESAVYRERLA